MKKDKSSIRLDKRTCKAFLDSGEIQITTIAGRKKYHISIPDYFKKYSDWIPKAMTLGIKYKKHTLKIIVEGKRQAKSTNKEILGIDLGINNFAVMSNNIFIKAKKSKQIKRKHAYLRKKLQSIGTRSAIRRLRILVGRERRYMTDFNHCISKNIAQMPFGVIAMENLKGIRKQKKSKRTNRMISNWSFFQLQSFVAYKCEMYGKSFVTVLPHYTSQRCSCCGFVDTDNRYKGTFKCASCGYTDSADYNASKNISQIGKILFEQVGVNQPKVTSDESEGSLHKGQLNKMIVTSHILNSQELGWSN